MTSVAIYESMLEQARVLDSTGSSEARKLASELRKKALEARDAA